MVSSHQPIFLGIFLLSLCLFENGVALLSPSMTKSQLFRYDNFNSRNINLFAGKSSASSSHNDGSTEGSNPRLLALEGVMQQIARSYGKGSLVKMGDSTALDVDKTSSGSYTLDVALGGGYPRGRVIEIFGPESSGKTTLALHAIAEIQKTGGTAAFIDVEHALDPEYAANLGVDVPGLYVCQPDSGEMALDVVDQLVRSAAVDIIVIDSVAALVPRAELEGDMGDMQVGLQARLMSKALRKITGSLSKSQTTVIFLNQLRSKVGIMYGNPEVTSGGNALKFYSSVRLDIRRKEILANNEGILVKVKVVKNKVYPPFRLVEFDILFGSGINKMGCLIDAGEAVGIVDRKGAWYSYGTTRLGQGRKSAIEFIANDSKVLREIEDGIKAAIKDKPTLKIPAGKNVEEEENEEGAEDGDDNLFETV